MNDIWEEKVWGRVKHCVTSHAMTSILEVNKGFRCSNHKHEHRWNRFHVISGTILVVALEKNIHAGPEWVDGEASKLVAGQMIYVPPDQFHRFEVLATGVIVETYWTTDGAEVDPNDIVRLDEGGPIV